MTTEGSTTATGSLFLMSVADVQPLSIKFDYVANTSSLFRFCVLFLRISQCFKCLNGPYILFSQ